MLVLNQKYLVKPSLVAVRQNLQDNHELSASERPVSTLHVDYHLIADHPFVSDLNAGNV